MDTGNKQNTQKTGSVADELSSTGSYYAMQKYCIQKGGKAFFYDEFEDRLPRPKKKNEPSGAKIIVRKSTVLKKMQSEEVNSEVITNNNPENSKQSGKTVPLEDFSEVEQLEKQLVKLINSLCFVSAKKSGKSNSQDLLGQIYHKLGELIKVDPSKVKSPLSSQLQRAYDKLRSVV